MNSSDNEENKYFVDHVYDSDDSDESDGD